MTIEQRSTAEEHHKNPKKPHIAEPSKLHTVYPQTFKSSNIYDKEKCVYGICSFIYALQLENAKQVALKNSDYATSTREELEGTRIKVESQSKQINSLQKQVVHR